MISLAFSRTDGLLDERDYWSLANSFVEHGELLNKEGQITAYRSPLLPWLLSPLAAVGLEINQARVIFTGLGVLALAGIWLLAVRLSFTPTQQLLVVVLAGWNPVVIFTFASIYPQSLLALGYVAALLLLTIPPKNIPSALVISAGLAVTLSICLLASPSSVFVFVPILLAFAYRIGCCSDWIEKGALTLFIGLLVCAAILGPYLHRNHTEVHAGFYLSLNSGVNLLLGNSRDTRPNSGVHVPSVYEFAKNPQLQGEYEVNESLTAEALKNIQADPGYYFALYLQKVANGFNNSADTYHKRNAYLKTLVAWAAFLGIFLGACYGVWSVAGLRVNLHTLATGVTALVVLVIATAFFLNIAGYALFFTRLRFRIPNDFLLAIPAAIGYAAVLSRLSNCWTRRMRKSRYTLG